MKKIIGIFFIIGVIFTSCEEKFNTSGDFGFEAIEKPVIIPPDATDVAVGKKGSSFTSNNFGWEQSVLTLKSHWHYSWGSDLKDELPKNVEFVPMKWGGGSTNDAFVAKMKVLKNAGKIHNLLGFNEPDGEKQANMTVDRAIELWPVLEQIGVPLGSPATVSMTNDWMKEFMQKTSEKNLRVDFIAVHWYSGPNVNQLINQLQSVYNQYGKPIWITEFAVADWDATTPAENRYTPERVLDFMKEVLPRLEELSFVHRYAWFPFGTDRAQGTSSALFNPDKTLTPLGEFYTNFEANANIEAAN